MKTKKTVIAVLTAMLVTAFIIGCITPLDETNSAADKKIAKNGKTLVRLNLGNANSNARTAVPDTSTYTAPEDFAHFKLNVLYGSSSTNNTPGDPVTLDSPYDDVFPLLEIYDGINWSFDVELEDDYYDFELIAYLDDSGDPADSPVAWGHDADVQIDSTHNTVNIALHEIFVDNTSSLYKGSLALTIDTTTNSFGGSYTVALMQGVTDYADLSSLSPGKYILLVTFSDDDCEDAVVREMVYIYSGFETECEIIAPVLRENVYTITFNYGDDDQGMSDTRISSTKVAHGTVISTAFSSLEFITDDGTSTGKPPYLTDTSKTFAGWYYFVGVSPTTAVGAKDKILKSITLYATWDTAATTIAGIGIATNWTGGPATVTASTCTGVYGVGGDNGRDILDLTLSVTLSSSASSYQWYHDRTGSTPIGTGDTLSLKFCTNDDETGYDEDDSWFMVGTHTITLVTEDGSYSFTFSYSP